MRIATWNMDAGKAGGGKAFLASLRCEVLLLTEVPRDLKLSGYRLHLSRGVMVRGQAFAAVATRDDSKDCVSPHCASVASEVDGYTFMASVLPWRSAQPADGFPGDSQGGRTRRAVEEISLGWPTEPVVWGGDGNHELSGRLDAGSKLGRGAIDKLVLERGMQVPTSELRADSGGQSVNHIAVPDAWKVMSAERHVAVDGARRLSDHDADVVEARPLNGAS